MTTKTITLEQAYNALKVLFPVLEYVTPAVHGKGIYLNFLDDEGDEAENYFDFTDFHESLWEDVRVANDVLRFPAEPKLEYIEIRTPQQLVAAVEDKTVIRFAGENTCYNGKKALGKYNVAYHACDPSSIESQWCEIRDGEITDWHSKLWAVREASPAKPATRRTVKRKPATRRKTAKKSTRSA